MVLMSAPTYVATREALKSLSPQDLTPVRFLSAAVILGAFLVLRRQRLCLRLRDLPRMVVVALFGYAGCGLLMNLGQTTVPAGTASLLLNISPIFAFFLGYLVLRERTNKMGYLGIVTALAGVVIITLGDSAAVGFNADALYIVAAALVLSVFLIVQQPLLKRVHPVEVVFWGSALGGLASLPAAHFDTDPSRFTATTWLSLAVLALVCTALASSFWNFSLLRTSVAEGGALLYVVPVFSLLLGWLLLGEEPTATSMLGGATALAGVVMLSQARPSVIKPQAKEKCPVNQPFIHEDIAPMRIPEQISAELHSLAVEAKQKVGGELVTVSLWRPDSQDLVRVFSNRPEVYRLGGISRQLGADWVRKCVIDQVSFLAKDEGAINSDAFENHDVLAGLGLGAAINAVIVEKGEFLGCLNLLGRSGAYSPANVAVADTYAREFARVLRPLQLPLPAE